MGSWITGQWPRALQLDDPRPVRLSSRALSLDATTLAERFKALGYRTIGAIANPNLNTRFGFAQGFDVYDEPDKLWRDEQGKVPGADIVDSFLAAVDDTPADQPLFGRLVLVDAHAPRKPPGAFRHAVRSKGAKRTGKRVQTYDAALLELDQHLARLFAEVRSRRPNVLFIFAADHGEGLSRPKRHGVGHGNHLYSSSISVPWIVHHPGLKQPGRTIPDVAMSIDLVPTVLELLGHPVPSDLPGASFADVLRGDAVSIPPRTAFAETFFRKSRKSAAFTGDHLLLRDFGDALKTESPSGFVDALYAVSDWKAENDLVEIETETYVALRASLDAWHVEMDQISAGAPPPAEIAPKESTMNQLRALGYVD
jgi:arylsulfatase A-like enzyme